MNLVIELRFHSKCGQQLFVLGDHPLLGGNDPGKVVPLSYQDPESWQTRIWLPDDTVPGEPIRYRYILREPDGTLIEDWDAGRELRLSDWTGKDIHLVDSWNYAGFYQNAFYSEPFQRVLLKDREADFQTMPTGKTTHRFLTKAPLLGQDETLCLVGNASSLNHWNTAQAIRMNRERGKAECWVDVALTGLDFPLEYKYGIYNFRSGVFVRYEEGPNRVLNAPPRENGIVLVRDAFARLPSASWKGAGVAVPVFSLRSEKSFGIGEFRDLRLFADWSSAAGLKLIQLLPVNDTIATHTWKDSYPYAAISAFALNPAYLCLSDIVTTQKNRNELEALEPERQRLNLLPEVDFEAILKQKLSFLQRIFPSEKKVLSSAACKDFRKRNEKWLRPYAVFCALRDRYGTSDFSQWPLYRQFQPELAEQLASGELMESVEFYTFIQFHLHQQLQGAVDYAHRKGIVLKGDIPIGIYRYGADAWQAPEQFNMEMQAGAPPDPFSQTGQNWGFPTYNWQRMRSDGYAWWRMRFAQMSHYFDAFRIDHILGFFRIWSVPQHAVEGILGHFAPALPVRRAEFEAMGIPFRRDHFLFPRIIDRTIAEAFGPESPDVIDQFLEGDRPGQYRLREGFRTQREIEAHFAGKTDARSLRLRSILFRLAADVLLLEDVADPEAFHFRFGVENTTAFKEMSPGDQARVRDLYIDYFYRRQDSFWAREALLKLPALKRATGMLICGEDLGMVPACVPEVMRDLGLLSLEVQRMPKALGATFFRPASAPYLSVVTPSTHDMSTIRGWWEEDRKLSQQFYTQELNLPGTAPEKCTPEISMKIIQQHLDSPAMWSIFQLQDLLGTDEVLRHADPEQERINIPAIPQYYWRYRMHLPLEKLLASDAFNSRLNQVITDAGRGS